MGFFSKIKNAVSDATKSVASATVSVAQSAQDKAKRTVTDLHTEALADLGNITGKGGLIRNPVSYAKGVGSGIKTDVKTGARVMGQFSSGQWGTLGKEAVGDLGSVFGASSKQIAKAQSKLGRAATEADAAGAAYKKGGQEGLATYGTSRAAQAAGVDPMLVNAAVAAGGAYASGGTEGLEAFATQAAKDEFKRRTGVDPDMTLDDLGNQGISRAKGFASDAMGRAQNIGTSASGMIGKGAGILSGTPLEGLGGGLVAIFQGIPAMLGETSLKRGAQSQGSMIQPSDSLGTEKRVSKNPLKALVNWLYV